MKSSPSRRAAALVAILCGVAVPAAALDVLEGLAPLDFRVPGLAGSESAGACGAGSPRPRRLDCRRQPRRALESGGPTLTDVGVATVAAEGGDRGQDAARRSHRAGSCGPSGPRDPGLRDALEDALDAGGEVDLSGVLDDLGKVDLGEGVPLEDVLQGGVLDLPTDDLQNLIDDLDDDLLGGLLGGGRRH